MRLFISGSAPLTAQTHALDTTRRALETITERDFAQKLAALAHDSTRGRETPSPELALPCGSMSITRVRCSAMARDAARFTAVVVLPTPPFWFVIAMTLAIPCGSLWWGERSGNIPEQRAAWKAAG